MFKTKKTFIRKLLNANDVENSSKRFITLIVAFHFILASFFILFLLGYAVFRDTKGDIEILKVIGNIFTTILEYDFFIIIVGLGFITAEQFTKVLVEKFKSFRSGDNGGWSQWNNWNGDDSNLTNEEKIEKVKKEGLKKDDHIILD